MNVRKTKRPALIADKNMPAGLNYRKIFQTKEVQAKSDTEHIPNYFGMYSRKISVPLAFSLWISCVVLLTVF